MKKYLAGLLFFFITMVAITSCKKEKSCEGCIETNSAPFASAGTDRIITLPSNSVSLDGTGSADPEHNITAYTWKKISGPSSCNMADANAAQTLAFNLAEGTYLFELKVTDARALFDQDTVQIEVNPYPTQQPTQQSLGNVIFYCPDPTGTVKFIWQTWDNGNPITGLYDLITIKIDNLSGSLAGVWCKNGCSPRCPVENDYNVELGNYAGFNLPPGTYRWSAENTITNFSGWPQVSAEFALFFGQTRKVEGTVTVLAGDKCILQPILF